MRERLLLLLALLFTSQLLSAQFTPGTSYFGTNQYIEYIAGDMPIIIVAPHSGNLQPASLPDINTRGSDNGTMDLSRFMADSLHLKSGGCRPHIIINHLRPSKLNPVHSASDSSVSAGTHPDALLALNEFHNFIQIAYDKVSTDWGKGHYFELHGNGTAEEWNMIGLGVSKNYLKLSDSVINTRVNLSTVKNLCTAGGANFIEVVKGTTSLGGMLDSMGWKSTTSPAHPAPPDSVTFFYAGQNTWRYGSKNSGTIDATHLESYWKFMVQSANKSKYSNDLADAMLRFMDIHYGFSFNCNAVGQTDIQNKSAEITVYPNPIQANQTLHIVSSFAIDKVTIFNAFGQVYNTKPSASNSINVPLAPGFYMLQVQLKNGQSNLQKLIIQ